MTKRTWIRLATACWLVGVALAAEALAASPKPRILFVVSAADKLRLKDGSERVVGYYSTEFSVPWKIFEQAGYGLDVATPGGKPPTVGAASLEPNRFKGGAKEANELKQWLEQLPQLKKPLPLELVKAASYGAIFVPGGLAPMQDLIVDPSMGRLLRDAHTQGKVLGLLCHGPATLLSAAEGDKWIFAGYKVTAYSNAEESDRLDLRMKLTPENGLTDLGALYSKAPTPHTEWAIRDRDLITGENPESAVKTAQLVLDALKERKQ